MNRSMFALGAAAAVLSLSACSSADDATNPTPTGSISSSPDATSTTTTSTTTTSTSTMTSAASPGSPGVPSTEALVKSCRVAMADQRGALAQLRTYVKNPLKGEVTVQEVDQTRKQLQADTETAPAPLQEELRTQVRVLNEAVQGIRTRDVKKVDVAAHQAAQARATAICKSAGK
jgi:hypothetical protein